MSVWKQTEAKTKLIISTLAADFADGDHTAFADHVLRTLAINNIIVADAEMFDEMADLCGPAMDELEDQYLDEYWKSRQDNPNE